jgi:hypothetical protein
MLRRHVDGAVMPTQKFKIGQTVQSVINRHPAWRGQKRADNERHLMQSHHFSNG